MTIIFFFFTVDITIIIIKIKKCRLGKSHAASCSYKIIYYLPAPNGTVRTDGRLSHADRGGRVPTRFRSADVRLRRVGRNPCPRACAQRPSVLPVNATATAVAAGVSTRLTTVSRAPTMPYHRIACIAFVAAAVAIVSQMSSGTSAALKSLGTSPPPTL